MVGRLRRMADHPPPRLELARADRPETAKMTLDLDREAVEWFKREATRHGGSCQRMIHNFATSYIRGAIRS